MNAWMIVSTLCGAASVGFAQTACEQFKNVSLTGATFIAVETVAAGPYLAPAGARRGAGGPAAGRGPAQPILLPAHCRIAATLKPSSDSDIKMELWMPVEDWNGKFEMVSNGGWAGIISFPQMVALKEQYATASTDTGHTGGNNGLPG